jgi:GPI mannosyltransferase 3
MIAINFAIAAYVTQIHQRGVMDVMSFLRHEHELKTVHGSGNLNDAWHKSQTTVGFLMPCHSTPWRSHLVYKDITAWALTCEPPIDIPAGPERDAYLDEADVFYRDPRAWLANNIGREEHRAGAPDGGKSSNNTKRDWPEYLVFFEQLEGVIRTVIEPLGYHECWRGFNTHWHDDWRRKGDVVVWCSVRA